MEETDEEIAEEEDDVNRRGFRSFKLEGGEFLVAQTPEEGLLTLSDTFVIDSDGASQRPIFEGDIPSHPQLYQTVEWASEYQGNDLEGKPANRWVFKVYLIKIESTEPYSVSFEEIYCIDGTTKTVSRCEIRRLAPPDTDENDLRLRIRDKVVTVDSVDSLPNPEQVHQAKAGGFPAYSRLEMEATEREDEVEALEAAARDEPEDGASTDGLMDDLLYDEESLKDFLVDVDDENDDDFEEFDAPSAEY